MWEKSENPSRSIYPVAMVELPVVQEVQFSEASEFLQYLDLKNERWGNGLRRKWVFRGHGNCNWELRPSAWREPGKTILAHLRKRLEAFRDEIPPTGIRVSYIKCDYEECLIGVAAERQAVVEFAELADEVGLPVDDVAETGYEILQWFYQGNTAVSASSNFYERPLLIDALAQHHGIPTRLLDWTRNPKAAALFAIQELLEDEKLMKECPGIAVWAVRLDCLDSRLVRVMTCPRSQHSFLHAQDGLFLWSPIGDQFHLRSGSWPCLEDLFQLTLSDSGRNDLRSMLGTVPQPIAPAQTPVFIKVVLDPRCSSDLFRLLLRDRMSRAVLMPSYSDVARSLKQEWGIPIPSQPPES